MVKRITWLALSMILLVSFILAGCTSGAPTGEQTEQPSEQNENTPSESEGSEGASEEGSEESPDPFGKYPEPVEITACRVKTSWMGFDEGEDENNNWWSRTYLEQLNIKLNVVWTAPNWGEPLETKITTCIATDDLPDLMPVYGSIAQRLAMADKIIDVKDIIDKYASPKVKEYLEIADGRALQSAIYNGKMIGIPNPGPLDPTYSVVWYRKDWLDKLGLQPPKTLEDIENLARAFMDNGLAEYGIAVLHKNFGGELILNMFGAYQGWIEKDGKLEYGLVQPEVKAALAKLHEWYKEGLLAKDFAVKDRDNELQADIASNKVGIIFDGTHFPNGGAGRALKKNNPEAEVDWVLIPTPSGEPAKLYASSRAGDFNCISKKCEHPEAIMKMINLKVAIFDPVEKPDFLKDLETNEYDTTKGGNMSFWNAVVTFDNIGKNYIVADMVNEEIKKGGDGSNLPLDARSTFAMFNSWLKEGTKAPNYEVNWAMYKLFNAENGADLITHRMIQAEPDKYLHYDAFAGLDTPAMAKYGSDIATKSHEYFIKAVMEGNIDQEFEAWVNYFYNNGGDEMTKEANEWYQSVKNQ
ncbi:extracellular solute-binding protein [Caldicoprobacter algeriensis]|uniref:extracellular solute-binding protein n=1 Tax=Caldicoprobacter algeriensis TaxID=699281 RepID=UPI00207A06D3|nr:extracellular solute-binding protein [Caldicoprobacter algeriensis]MCM8900063.1 extracellular solute-binding protein [Caldicoprobacter algeriensis]